MNGLDEQSETKRMILDIGCIAFVLCESRDFFRLRDIVEILEPLFLTLSRQSMRHPRPSPLLHTHKHTHTHTHTHKREERGVVQG